MGTMPSEPSFDALDPSSSTGDPGASGAPAGPGSGEPIDPFLENAGERLHPLSLLFTIGSSVRSLLIPGLVMLFLARGGSGGSRYELWLMILFVPAVIHSIMRYISFRYILAEDELVVREGIITRNTRHIPYARIQNVDQVRNVFHRMFGVSNVSIETASGGTESEATLRVLSIDAVRTMRERIFHDRNAAARAAEAAGADPDGLTEADGMGEAAALDFDASGAPRGGRPVFKMTLDDVVAFGMMSNRGLAIIAAAAGIIWQFDLSDALLRVLRSEIPDFSGRTAWLLGALALLVGLLGVWLLSVVWAVLSLFAFRLVRVGEDLRVSCGLFTRLNSTTPRYRIQFLVVRERALHRLFKRLSIRVETAGGDMTSDPGISRKWLVPLARREELPQLLDEIQPELSLENVDWRPIDSRALRRLFRKGLFLSLVFTGALMLLIDWKTVAVLIPLGLFAYGTARLRVRSLGFALAPGVILFRDGWWTRKRCAVRYSKVQTVSVDQNPFDRRYGMAVLTVDTAGAWGTTQRIRIPFLPLKTARELLGRLRSEASSTEFRW